MASTTLGTQSHFGVSNFYGDLSSPRFDGYKPKISIVLTQIFYVNVHCIELCKYVV